jgi:hypothetical protein
VARQFGYIAIATVGAFFDGLRDAGVQALPTGGAQILVEVCWISP